jgi:hypothetical protein
MTTPEMVIQTTDGTRFTGWCSETEDTVEEFIDKIAQAPSGAMVEVNQEFEVDGEDIEKSLYLAIDEISFVRKPHSQYVEEMNE